MSPDRGSLEGDGTWTIIRRRDWPESASLLPAGARLPDPDYPLEVILVVPAVWREVVQEQHGALKFYAKHGARARKAVARFDALSQEGQEK